MQLGLDFECYVAESKMLPVSGGSYCNNCKKTVVDYSVMSDAEVLSHIEKHGLGCGKFNEDQLNRDLFKPATKKKTLFYLPFLLILFLRPMQAFSQCKQVAYQKLEAGKDSTEKKYATSEPLPADTACGTIKYRMGTGNIRAVRKPVIHKRKWSIFNIFKSGAK